MNNNNSIQTISFVGSGNVATLLAAALQKAGLRIMEVFSVHHENARRFAAQFNCRHAAALQELEPVVDLLMIAVPDARVEEVAKKLPAMQGIVAHTSGITAMEVLADTGNYGVFYPLQTFTKDRIIDISDVPFCIEGNSGKTVEQLFDLACKISSSVQMVNSGQRKQFHLAAVLVNNFTNHLYGMAYDYLEKQGLDFKLLLPLIRETAAKLRDMDPGRAQTGPARRNDEPTLQSHLKML